MYLINLNHILLFKLFTIIIIVF